MASVQHYMPSAACSLALSTYNSYTIQSVQTSQVCEHVPAKTENYDA